LDIILALAGIWTIIVGKLPSWIIGKRDHELTGMPARIIGLVLVLPVPISFTLSTVIAMVYGEKGAGYAFIVGVAVLITALIVALVLIRKYRVPKAPGPA
jgi:uncharacterized PurR-regulated membrane protein YhhQ (DUF165 family)